MLERRLLWIESSNPPTPASQCGLSYSISGCASTADIPAGYAGAPESLVGKFRTFGSEPGLTRGDHIGKRHDARLKVKGFTSARDGQPL
jgi:hypothetical protein